jgi:tetratricopeptide (TPR) repeat protein
MPINAYDPCPCGSGKKFKWCCQPFYGDIERAFAAHANGQHDTALKILKELTEQHGANPEVWGKYAELLWENQREEEAEAALRKAMEVNPHYAFGHFLQGMFRHSEGENRGALLLYRKAANACDPESKALLAEIYSSIGQCELLSRNLLAARAAWEIALRLAPDAEELHERFEAYFGAQPLYPPLVARAHALMSLPADAPRPRQEAWREALASCRSGRLSDAAAAFEKLASDDAGNAAAWYNLGLIRAWLGENTKALQAFDAYVTLEANEDAAAEAWALSEVLRFGVGLEEQSDYTEHHAVYQIRDPQALGAVLSRETRLINVTQDEETGVVQAAFLDRAVPAAHENLALFELPRVAARLMILGPQFRLFHGDAAMLDKARAYLEEKCAAALGPPQLETMPMAFSSLVQSFLGVRVPQGVAEEKGKRLVISSIEQHFEEDWLHRPLRSLSGVKPIDAAGAGQLRKKVLGVVRFLEDMTPPSFPYSFDRLRHKLGLTMMGPGPSAAAAQGEVDYGSMSAAELADVKLAGLGEAALRRAFQAALRLDARELAGRFAESLLALPAAGDAPDRHSFYMHLANLAVEREEYEEALAHVESGERQDCEHNEGRRRNDYEFQKARVLLKQGQGEAARDVLVSLTERTPSDLELLGKATEMMLSARRGGDAAKFAEKGLARAKQSTDRDRVGYFEELLAAARR